MDTFNFLKQLLPIEELTRLELGIQNGETPLWRHWEEFVTKHLRTGKSEVTVLNVRDSLRFIIQNLNIHTIEQCNNPRLLEESLFASKEKRGFSNTTFNSRLKNLNTYFIWLEKMEYISENKIKKVSRCKEAQNEQYTLSEEQVRLIVGRVHTRRQSRLLRFRNVFFIDLLRFTGARPCELLEIRVQDIQKEKETYKLKIIGKKQKGKPRYYPFPSYVRDSFEAYMPYRNKLRNDEPMLFISSSKKKPWSQKGMRKLFSQLSKELGFKVNAYGFRRYVATTLNAKGVKTNDIKNYLGHGRITTTERYIEKSTILTQKGAEVMGMSLS